jgi:hypothetical protein
MVKRGCRTTGAWISVLPWTVNGMELYTVEFHDAALLQYVVQAPLNLPAMECDGCCKAFTFTVQQNSILQGMSLFISCHDKIKDELGQLASKALKPSVVATKSNVQAMPKQRLIC